MKLSQHKNLKLQLNQKSLLIQRDTVRPMWISIATSVAIRVPLAYFLVGMTRTPELPQGNCAMMYVSMLISWSLGAVITLVVYRMGKWKAKANLVAG